MKPPLLLATLAAIFISPLHAVEVTQFGEVVGQTAHTFEWSDWRDGEIWWIQSVYVHPLHRGRGVFRALFAHIKQPGEKDAECCGIRLYMERENDSARKSYLRLGISGTGYEVLELLFPISDLP